MSSLTLLPKELSLSTAATGLMMLDNFHFYIQLNQIIFFFSLGTLPDYKHQCLSPCSSLPQHHYLCHVKKNLIIVNIGQSSFIMSQHLQN